MIIDFNDQVNLQEKIYFTKSNEPDKVLYFPLLRKEDIKSKKYKIGKFFHLNNIDNFLFKITISLYTFTNHRILPIGSEEIYLKVCGKNPKIKMRKFYFY